MSDKKIKVGVEVDDSEVKQGTESLKSYAAQLRAAKLDLISVEQQFGKNSAEYKKAQRAVNDLKEAQEELNRASKPLAERFKELGGPIGRVATLVDDVGDKFSALKGGLSQLGLGFKTLGQAIATSGIGALVLLLGLIVAAVIKAADSFEPLQRAFGRATAAMGKIMDVLKPVTDFILNVVTAAIDGLATAIGFLTGSLEEMNKEAANAEGLKQLEKNIKKQEEWLDANGDKYDQYTQRKLKANLEYNKKTAEIGKDETKTEAEKLALLKQYRDKANREIGRADSERNTKARESADARNKEAAARAKQAAADDLARRRAELDAKIKLETDKEVTNRDTLKKLLDARYKTELEDKKLSNAEKLVLQADYAKKLEEAIKADEEKARKARIAELDASIQMEVDKAETSYETLKTLLDARLKEELANEELGQQQKLAIKAKYDKQLDEAIKADQQKKKADTLKFLQEELSLAEGNLQSQLAAYESYKAKITGLVGVTEKEKSDIVKTYQDAILKTITDGFAAQETLTEEKYGEFKRFETEYYTEKRNNLLQSQAELDASLKAGAISEKDYNTQKAGFAKANVEIDKMEAASKVEMVSLAGNALGQLSEIVGKDTVAGKAFAIAKATIDTYQSAVAAYKALAGIPIVGPVLGGIAAAAAIATGIATVKKIVAVQVPPTPTAQKIDAGGGTGGGPIQVNAGGMADGGYVQGPGTGRSDSIPTMLSNGEYVINAKGTKTFGPILNAINDYGRQPQANFALGGSVNSRPAPSGGNTSLIDILGDAMSKNPIKTYVVSQDMSTQQMFDRTIKSRSTI